MKSRFLKGLALLLGAMVLWQWPEAPTRRVLPALHPEPQQFLPALQRAKKYDVHGRPTGLIVPHHLLARQFLANAFATVAGSYYRRVVMFCPDHFHLGRSPISVIDADFTTPFGIVRSDPTLIRALAQVPGVTTSDVFYREHGIGSLLPFLHHEMPNATVCAIAIKADVTKATLDNLFEALKGQIDDRTLIVQSTDFSHYLTEAKAEINDQVSRRVLLSEDPNQAFTIWQPDFIDSVGALYLQTRLQREVFHSKPKILDHLNSQSFADHPVEQTTSYFVVAYTAGDPPPEAEPGRDGTLLFAGDVMLGRGVANLAETKGMDAPFQGLASAFHGAGAVVVNLEGPMATPNRPEAPLRFHFAPEFASALGHAGVTHVSLANNHTLDQGPQGLEQTRASLRQAGLTPFGHPAWNAVPEVTRIDLAGAQVLAVGFNATEPYFQLDRKTAFLKQLRKENPRALIAVSIHWGHEYMPRANPVQRRFGRAFIEAGADLVVGHHPHVIQDLERYQGGLIVYSLGNLVFDQWAKAETRSGLMLRVSPSDRGVQLIPMDTGSPIPSMAPSALRSQTLTALALICPPELKGEILSGRIRISVR